MIEIAMPAFILYNICFGLISPPAVTGIFALLLKFIIVLGNTGHFINEYTFSFSNNIIFKPLPDFDLPFRLL